MKISIPGDVIFEVLDGETVVLNLTSSVYFSLNPVATRVWGLIQEHGDLQAIRSAMIDQFDVDADVLDADLKQLIAELSERKLVICDSGAGS